jgi:hypothetical protein
MRGKSVVIMKTVVIMGSQPAGAAGAAVAGGRHGQPARPGPW